MPAPDAKKLGGLPIADVYAALRPLRAFEDDDYRVDALVKVLQAHGKEPTKTAAKTWLSNNGRKLRSMCFCAPGVSGEWHVPELPETHDQVRGFLSLALWESVRELNGGGGGEPLLGAQFEDTETKVFHSRTVVDCLSGACARSLFEWRVVKELGEGAVLASGAVNAARGVISNEFEVDKTIGVGGGGGLMGGDGGGL